jgi:hypothetical protein
MIGFISGITNALRGKGFIKTWVFNAAVGSFIAGYTVNGIAFSPLYHIACCIIGVAIWKSRGWGLYFSAFNGYWDRTQTEVRWIDSIGYKIVPFVDAHNLRTNRMRGLICMAFRGAAYSAPLFIYLGFVLHPLSFFLWLLMVMQGVFYWAAYWVKNDFNGGLQVSAAEIATVWFMVDLIGLL